MVKRVSKKKKVVKKKRIAILPEPRIYKEYTKSEAVKDAAKHFGKQIFERHGKNIVEKGLDIVKQNLNIKKPIKDRRAGKKIISAPKVEIPKSDLLAGGADKLTGGIIGKENFKKGFGLVEDFVNRPFEENGKVYIPKGPGSGVRHHRSGWFGSKSIEYQSPDFNPNDEFKSITGII